MISKIKSLFLSLLLLSSFSSYAQTANEKVLIQALDPYAVNLNCGDNSCSLSINGQSIFNTFSHDLRGAMKSQIINARLNGQVIDIMSAPGKLYGSYIFLRTHPMSQEEANNKVRELTVQLESAKRELRNLKAEGKL